jgi:hypothetical protein
VTRAAATATKVALEDSAANRTRLGLFEVDWKGFEELLRQSR